MSFCCVQAVKSLGSTLKAFQPTIREIVSVSSDLKNTLEEQIGLDDIRSEIRNSVVPEPRPRPLPEQVRLRLWTTSAKPHTSNSPSNLTIQGSGTCSETYNVGNCKALNVIHCSHIPIRNNIP